MITNQNRGAYSTTDWVTVITYNPDTSFGPLPIETARSYVNTRGGKANGFFLVPDPDAKKEQDRLWDAIRRSV
jgi:hypothetical protein